ncbi:hypothetical protein, partial [Vibrio alginolyticus]|uniref:hypothetical protein n=1 Tax=Vibrio alginolyticus TaxID=663 RepID=UPI001A8C4ED8
TAKVGKDPRLGPIQNNNLLYYRKAKRMANAQNDNFPPKLGAAVKNCLTFQLSPRLRLLV